MTSHKHEQSLQFHTSSLLQCDDGRSLLITQDGQQTDDRRTEISNQCIFNYLICGSPFYVMIRSSKAPRTILAHPVLHRFFVLGLCYNHKILSDGSVTMFFLCFFTTVKFDPIPTTYPHAKVYAIPICVNKCCFLLPYLWWNKVV